MTAGSLSRSSAVALAMLSLATGPAAVHAQIPGDNVNMVTGTQWPGGDPFLQRQNEPSLAVSTANPQHLLAGANDYRSVDLPYPFGPNDPMKMPGDAWLGVFKSFNGGQTWQSVLMPGFPQDTSSKPFQGAQSPLRNCVTGSTASADRCTSSADPVIRAGTDGMLYYSGIAFKRGTNHGKVFLTRFIDLNNKENGDPTRTDATGTKADPTDPLRYIDQIVIANGSATEFLDKPWIAVDRPRLLARTCTVTVPGPDGVPVTKSFPGGAIYAAYVRFPSGVYASDIMFTRSGDCGKTWMKPVKLNDSTSTLNQAPSIAIDPFTGYVYVTWRRLRVPAAPAPATQGDAIMVARSFRGFVFTMPRLVASFDPFEQGSTPTMFRTEAFPTIAVSVDRPDFNGWVHIAWSQRMGPDGDARIVTSTAPVLPAPYNGLESSDPCNGWTAPVAADDVGLSEIYGEGSDSGFRVFARGHQFMPSLTFSQGRLVLLYYDSRLSHTASVFKPNDPFQPDLFGSFYLAERVPITPWSPQGPEVAPEDAANIYTSTIDDANVTRVRHTVEVRVGVSPPGAKPVFTSEQVSKYRFGERGDEPANFRVPRFVGTDPTQVSTRADGLVITDAERYQRLQQFDVNVPNLPMFKNGTVPFLGDYIDIQGLAFVRKGSVWTYNTERTPAPVFHAVWTSNQDVRAPADGDWSHYTPMKLPGQTSIFDPTASASQINACIPGAPANEGTRNQNIYTARITEGLLVSSPQNVKPLSSSQTRSFVVVAHNDTKYPKAFRFSFTGLAPASCVAAMGGAAPTSCASFSVETSVPAVDVEVLPHSSVTRSLFVRSTSVATALTVNVNEVKRPMDLVAPATCDLAILDCPYVTGGLSGFVTLNPPGSSPALVPPDGSTTSAGTTELVYFANVSTANVSTANVSTANVSTANISTANVSTANVCTANVSTANVSTANVCTANVSTANVSTANVSTANVTTANISTANVSTANVSTANVSTANVSTANVSTANVSTANVSTANVSTAPVSDLNYEITNTGNTTTSFSVQFVCPDGATCPTSTPLHLMVNKFYAIPASVGCQLVVEPRPVLVSNAGFVQETLIPANNLIDPKVREGSASNATVSLAPGEKAQVTLRGRITLAEMARIGAAIAPAIVPHGTPRGGTIGGTQTYAQSTLVNLPATSTTTTVTASGNAYTATVMGAGGVPTGKVTFIAGGSTLVGVGPLDVTGKATLTASIPVGTTLVAYYGGDSRFKASSGAYTAQLATTLELLNVPSGPTLAGQNLQFIFRLTAPPASPMPTGTVQVSDGSGPVGAPSAFVCSTFWSDTGNFTTCGGAINVVLPPGDHTLTAAYSGDAGYLASTSPPLSWSVSNATVAINPATASVQTDLSTTFSALVTNAISQGVIWVVQEAGGGSIGANPDGTATYTAPSSIATSPSTFHVVATSVHDLSASASAAITVTRPAPPPSSILQINATVYMQANLLQNGTYNGFNTTVTDGAGLAIPTSELRVTVVASSNPANVMSIPAYNGYFATSGLSFNYGDTITMEVVRTESDERTRGGPDHGPGGHARARQPDLRDRARWNLHGELDLSGHPPRPAAVLVLGRRPGNRAQRGRQPPDHLLPGHRCPSILAGDHPGEPLVLVHRERYRRVREPDRRQPPGDGPRADGRDRLSVHDDAHDGGDLHLLRHGHGRRWRRCDLDDGRRNDRLGRDVHRACDRRRLPRPRHGDRRVGGRGFGHRPCDVAGVVDDARRHRLPDDHAAIDARRRTGGLEHLDLRRPCHGGRRDQGGRGLGSQHVDLVQRAPHADLTRRRGRCRVGRKGVPLRGKPVGYPQPGRFPDAGVRPRLELLDHAREHADRACRRHGGDRGEQDLRDRRLQRREQLDDHGRDLRPERRHLVHRAQPEVLPWLPGRGCLERHDLRRGGLRGVPWTAGHRGPGAARHLVDRRDLPLHGPGSPGSRGCGRQGLRGGRPGQFLLLRARRRV